MKDLEFTESEKAEWIYDVSAGIMAVIAVIVVMLGFSNQLTEKEAYYINVIDNIIYFIFVIDYVIRLILSKNKKFFLINNLIDFLAILPIGLLPSFKYGSVLKLIRVLTYLLRLIGDLKEIMFTNNFIYALGVIIIITIVGSIGIYIFEYNNNVGINNYEDALWWSIVTVSTVGYGDITVVTRAGRIVASILMITGIGFLSMFTSTISTFFLNKYVENRMRDFTDYKKTDILDISNLSEEDKKNMVSYYNFLCFKDRI